MLSGKHWSADVQHREIDYGIKMIGPSKWRWTIYVKVGTGSNLVSTATHPAYDSYDLAEAACKTEIDHNLDGDSNAPRS